MKLNHVCNTRIGQINDQTAMPDFPGAAACVKRGTRNQTTMKLKHDTAYVATGLTAGNGMATARINYLSQAHLTLTAPSMRLPATRANRTRLRALREAELRAWDAASPNAALRAEVRRSLAINPPEFWLIGGVTAIAVGALAIGAASAFNFVAQWDRFVSFVATLIG